MAGHQTLNSIYVVRLLTREPHHRKQLRRRDPQHRARGDQQLRLRVQDGAQVAFLQRVMGLAVGWPVPESLVVCDLDGKVVGGGLRPSSDMPTHAVIYRAWGDRVGGVVHAHSNATVTWAQAGHSIPCYGTTQVDYCHGEVPCMRRLTEAEI